MFYHAIKSRYPEIQLVADVWGSYPQDPRPDLVDEHYYNNPEFFMRQANHYDSYDRQGPKVFVGEYAVTQGSGQGNLRAAVGEAAFMTGLERNSDIVAMASYAPLFVNLNHRKWNPDLINFDSSSVYGLPSYYVQQLFSQNRGDVTLPTSVESPSAETPFRSGAVGVGTWRTRAEFKDFRVTQGDKVLFASDFAQGTDGWKLLGGGDWHTTGNLLRQDSEAEFIRALVGDKSWNDYTISVKARKLGGQEGFLVLFRVNNDGDKCWWNVGGWGNAQHGIELNEIMIQTPGRIETGRWYDLRVEVKGQNIKCYLDGKLVHDFNQAGLPSLFASATQDQKAGQVILKVVNGNEKAMDTEINIQGAKQLAGTGQALVLSSENPMDENTLAQPDKVSPKSEAFTVPGPSFRHTFPGNSVTVLRLGARVP
jgi:alpha-L-arabinofuranosidase